MKIKVIDPPRQYPVGRGAPVTISDCARVALDADEQVTFVTPAGGEYDVTRKSWGFYATPSINGRLRDFGLRAVLVKSPLDKYYVMLVERGSEAGFHEYLVTEGHVVVSWLDDLESLRALERAGGSR